MSLKEYFWHGQLSIDHLRDRLYGFHIHSFEPKIPSSINMRHKKDGYSAKGKKHPNAPRRPTAPNEDGEAQNRRPPFKAACWDLEHCDPKRCSGKRLMHFGLMRELSIGQKFQGVVISYAFGSHWEGRIYADGWDIDPMRKKSSRRQIRSFWSSMGLLWLSALGSGLRKSHGGRLVASVKDYVWLMRSHAIYLRTTKLSDRFQQYHILLRLTQSTTEDPGG